MPLVPTVQVVGGALTSGVGVVTTVATVGQSKTTKDWTRRGTEMICQGGEGGKQQLIGLSRAAKALLKIAIRGRSEEVAAELEEGMEEAELGLEGANTTLIEHVPGAGVVVGGVHLLTGHKDEALRAYGRAANSTLPLVGALAGNATSAGLVTAGILAPEIVLPMAGICAVGGALGALGGYALQLKCERGVSDEAKSRDTSFSDAHSRSPLEVTTDVLVGAGTAALSGGLAKGIRREVVPKWKIGETSLTYNVKKQVTEGCIKTGVTEIPKALRQKVDSVDQAAEVTFQLVANIGIAGLTSGAGEYARKSVLNRVDPAFPKAQAICAASAKSAASASVRATKSIVASTYERRQIDLVEPAMDIIAEGGAGAVTAIGENVTKKNFFKKPAEKISQATAQQVKKIVKGKNKSNLAAILEDTVEDTVVRLADVNEKITTFGKGTAKDLACTAAARFARAGQPEDTTEIVDVSHRPANDPDITNQFDNHQESGDIILEHDVIGFAEPTTQTGNSQEITKGLERFQEGEYNCDNVELVDANSAIELALEITEQKDTLQDSLAPCVSLTENPEKSFEEIAVVHADADLKDEASSSQQEENDKKCSLGD